ncbi:MAG: abortive infection system antitoxin AbiGi family protein, partial [Burkholderiaceae bacterium]
MPLSANTLIHFTNNKDALKKILEEHFKIFHCKENIVFPTKNATYIAPMVSFCDIPLSQVKDHIAKYGDYGIGMTKEWGIKKGLNPVLYISKESNFAKNLDAVFRGYLKHPNNSETNLEEKELALHDILRHIKNYEGPLKRKDIAIDNYRYSDEREWRYTPDFKEDCAIVLSNKEYSSEEQKKTADLK